MSAADLTWADIKAMMQADVRAIAAELAPGGKTEGGYWIAPNPSRDGDKPGSFKIWLHGPACGCWVEYDGADDERGDIVDLVIYARAARDKGEVWKWALARFGLADAAPAAREKAAARAKSANAERERQEQRQRARKIEIAREMFGRGHSLTPACWGWRYYRDARGIGVDALAAIAAASGAETPFPDLRFIGHCRYDQGRHFPAIVGAMRGADGALNAAHRTYLDPETGGKAKLGAHESAKKMLGAAKGCAIRVWTPPGAGALVLNEGVENALSCAVAKPDMAGWATGSLDGLLDFDMPADGAPVFARVLVFADNDWTRPQAVKKFDAALRRLRAQGALRGFTVSVARAPVGKDANDYLTRQRETLHGTG